MSIINSFNGHLLITAKLELIVKLLVMHSNSKAFTLIEVMVALGVSAILMSGMVTMFSNSVKSGKNLSLGTEWNSVTIGINNYLKDSNNLARALPTPLSLNVPAAGAGNAFASGEVILSLTEFPKATASPTLPAIISTAVQIGSFRATTIQIIASGPATGTSPSFTQTAYLKVVATSPLGNTSKQYLFGSTSSQSSLTLNYDGSSPPNLIPFAASVGAGVPGYSGTSTSSSWSAPGGGSSIGLDHDGTMTLNASRMVLGRAGVGVNYTSGLGAGSAGVFNFGNGTGNTLSFKAGGPSGEKLISMHDDGGGVVLGDPASRASTPTTVEGNLTVNGNISYTGSISGPSDARLKEQIIPVTEALEKLDKLRGIYFKWKNSVFMKLDKRKTDQNRHLGVLAQEVQAVFPELVTEGSSAFPFKQVDYAGLVVPLIEGVKELKAQLEHEKERSKKIEERLELLEKALKQKAE